MYLAASLSKIVKKEVDIGILSHKSLIYSTEVIAKGDLLFSKDEYYSDLFSATHFVNVY